MTTGPQRPTEDTAPPPLPDGYPDLDIIGWVRTEEIEFGGLRISMTITPGTHIVQLWALDDDGRPVGWIGNAFRLHSHAPCLRVSNNYRQVFSRSQQNALAARAADFQRS